MMSVCRYIVAVGVNCAIALSHVGLGAAQVPQHLNPSPNPLQFPTLPQEVKIQHTQPITLRQALELARRNNLQLQEVSIQVERSQAALQELQALESPTVNLSTALSLSESVMSQLSIEQPVNPAYSQLQSNLNNVQTTHAAVNQAKESLRVARLRFQTGVGTQTEVIEAENDLTRAQANLAQAVLSYNRALAQLRRAVTSRGAGYQK